MPSLTRCRSCDSSVLKEVLDLGLLPLANSLVDRALPEKSEPRFPLRLIFCAGCSLVQITETVSPDILFRDYVYFSSFSDTMLEHVRKASVSMIQKKALGSDSLVMEIASNDGYLLKNFVKAGIPVLGIEPALNVAAVAEKNGVKTVSQFFSLELANQFAAEGKFADVIFANNVMAHIPEINGVVRGIKKILKSDGIFVMETPYLKPFMDHLEFDTIYHEHLFYYSLTALQALFARHELEISDVEFLSIHGGSARVFVSHAGKAENSAKVLTLLDDEKKWGVLSERFYSGFSDQVASLRTSLKDLLLKLKSEGKTLAAYGAAAKGSTLLNSIGVGAETIDFVVDRSPYKQGKYTPGGRIPILKPEALLEKKPDFVLILAWNFAEEIMSQQQEFAKGGGRYILPIPEVRVL